MSYAGVNRENLTPVRVIRTLVEAGLGHRILIAQGVCRETQLGTAARATATDCGASLR